MFSKLLWMHCDISQTDRMGWDTENLLISSYDDVVFITWADVSVRVGQSRFCFLLPAYVKGSAYCRRVVNPNVDYMWMWWRKPSQCSLPAAVLAIATYLTLIACAGKRLLNPQCSLPVAATAHATFHTDSLSMLGKQGKKDFSLNVRSLQLSRY